MTTRETPEHPGDMPNPESTTPEQLRTWAETVNKRNKALEAEAVTRGLSEIGLKADTGLGKAIAREYKGDVSTEAITAYAKDEYGYEKPSQPETPEGGGEATTEGTETPATTTNGSEDPQDVERRTAIEATQGQAAQAQAHSTNVVTETEADRLAKHDEKLASEEATRTDATSALTDKLAAYRANRPM